MASRLYRDTGVVLRSYKLGESDRIIVFFTEQNGKVRAVAKGVRKTRSKFGGRLEPFSLVDLQLHRGRDLDIVNQVESIDTLSPVFGDLDCMTQASAILEAIDQLVPDREPVPALYRMLVGVRQIMLTSPSPLVVPAFLWKLLASEGLRPQLDACVLCNELRHDDEPFTNFDLEHGGVVCATCHHGLAISVGALNLMRDVLGGHLSEVLTKAHNPQGQQRNDPIINEVAQLATRAFEHHIERRLRSLAIFERH